MTFSVLGVDPGLGVSHAAVVTCGPAGFTLHSTAAWATPEEAPVARPLLLLSSSMLIAGLVESARGTVLPDRDADPVLRDAMMCGRLLEVLRHARPDLAFATVPAFGTVTGWNWRSETGCNGMTDAGIRIHLERLLSCEFPRGPRGGKASHFPDAAGVALAGAQRLHRAGVTADSPANEILSALTTLSPLEAAVQDGVKTRKQERRKGRALARRYS